MGRRTALETQSGSALVAVLVTLVALSAVAAAVWATAYLELLISTSHREGVQAFYLAESGWNRVVADARVGGDLVPTVLYPGRDSIRVRVRPLHLNADTAVFAVRSTGYRVGPEGGHRARRSVEVLVVRDASGIRLWPGSWREVW